MAVSHDTSQKSSIEIDFSVFHNNAEKRIEIKREWFFENKKLHETIIIRENNFPIHIRDEDLQLWVNEIFPPNFYSFIFFDAEKIGDFSSKDSQRKIVREYLWNLMGLNLIDRLENDLGHIIVFQNKQKISSGVQNEYENYCKEKTKVEKEIVQQQNNLELLRFKQIEQKQNIELLEQQIISEGGQYISRYPILSNQLSQVEENIKSIQEEIFISCSNLIPFALSPNLSKKLLDRLENEKKIIYDNLLAESWNQKVNQTISKINDNKIVLSNYGIDNSSKTKIIKILKEIMPLETTPKKLRIYHNISDQDRERIKIWIDNSHNETKKDVNII